MKIEDCYVGQKVRAKGSWDTGTKWLNGVIYKVKPGVLHVLFGSSYGGHYFPDQLTDITPPLERLARVLE